jgi:hypothetical protein
LTIRLTPSGFARVPSDFPGEDDAALFRTGRHFSRLSITRGKRLHPYSPAAAAQCPIGHQFVKVLRCAPASGIDANAGDAQLVSQLGTVNRMVDGFLTLLSVGADKSLMRAEIAQRQTIDKGGAF